MNIIIIANFTDIHGSRFREIARLFANKKHNVVLITSDFSHGKKEHLDKFFYESSYTIEYIHESGYPSNVSIKRLYSHWRWGHQVLKYLKNHEKPDIIYCAIPSLTVGTLSADYCKKNHVKFVVDIQDLWPEAFCLLIKNKLFQLILRPLEWMANKSYKSADLIVAVSKTYCCRGLSVNKKGAKGLTVFLGNHIDLFDKYKVEYKQKKYNNDFLIAYVGTIGYSYDIPCVIDGIALYRQQNSPMQNVRLVAIGGGPLIEKFSRYAKDKNVDVTFTEALPYQKMVGLMCSCDVVINPIRKGAAQSITNKVGDYAFSGLAVINTQECQEYRDLIDEYDCGINCDCGNVEDISNAIKFLIENPKVCKKMGLGARKLGEEKFNRESTYNCIIEAVENLFNNGK